MALILHQTATAATHGSIAACVPLTVVAAPTNAQMTRGGTSGGAVSQTIAGSITNGAAVMFESASFEPGVVQWKAGNYVIRLNVTAANSNLTWASCAVCRVNSSGTSQGTIVTSSTLAIALGTTGVKSATLSGTAQNAASGDRLYLVLGFTNAKTSSQSFSYTRDQDIDTPIDDISQILPALLTGELARAEIRRILRPRPRHPVGLRIP